MVSVQPSGPAAGGQALELPVIIDERQRRSLLARVSLDLTRVDLASEPLLAALEDRLRPDVYADLAAATQADGFLPLGALVEAGLQALFDPSALTIRITVPPEASRLQVIRLRSGEPPELAGVRVEPSPYSGFVNVAGAFDWLVTTSSALEPGLQPVRLELDGAANAQDWVIEGGVTIEEHAVNPWSRRETRMVRDWPERRLRLQLGDLVYRTSGFQRSQALGGVSLATNSELQPYKVFEPAGSQEFTLDTQSKVDVIVNGRVARSLTLLPGRYDLRDFRLGSGINDVTIRIVDTLGRVRELHFGLSFEPRLLAPGTSEYSLSAGLPTVLDDGLVRYDRDQPSYSLFHRYGVNDSLTLGAYAQGDEDRVLFGLESVHASGLGGLRADVALSDDDELGTAYAARVQYEYYDSSQQNSARRRWLLSAAAQGRRFGGLGGSAPDNPVRYELAGTLSQDFGSTGISGHATAVWARGRGDTLDTTTVSMSLRRRVLRDWELELTLDRELVQGERPEQTVFLTIAWSQPDRNHSARFDHDTTDHSTRLEWQYTPPQTVGGTATSLRATRRPADYELGASLQHVGMRFEGDAFHTSSVARTHSGLYERRTSLRLASALVFAGGELALSRPVTESFAVVAPHESLAGRTIGIDRSAAGSQARIDRFGAAVLPNLIPYQVRAVSIDAPDLPPGFDLGEELFELRPRYRSGLLVRVGTSATVAARGVLRDAAGEPLALEGGVATALDGSESFVFFTNRTGRFSLAGLRPGRYELRLHSAPQRTVSVEIPQDAAGLYELGALTLPAAPGSRRGGAR